MELLRMTEIRKFRAVVFAIPTILVGGLVAWSVWGTAVKKELAEQTADVAEQTLSSETLQARVNILSSEVVHMLLTDQTIFNQATDFVTKLIQTEMVLNSVTKLAQDVLARKETQASVQMLVNQLIEDQQTLDKLAELLRSAVLQDGNQEALQSLLAKVGNDPSTRELLAHLGSQAVNDVLNDPNTYTKALTFTRQLLADPSIHHQGGQAVWDTVKAALGLSSKPAEIGDFEKTEELDEEDHVPPPTFTN